MNIRFTTLLAIITPFVLFIIAAYIQWMTVGLPVLPSVSEAVHKQQGFPAWLRVTHFVNFFFLVLLVRSGLQILMDHPRLYWNVHCTPGTEWFRLTPVKVPHDRVWTAKDDSRYLSPLAGLPGYRHTIGMARHWHFLSVLFWVANGIVYVFLLFGTGEWRRLIPDSWQILPDAWAIFTHYATFHPPLEPDSFFHYNALQQLVYFSVVFILTPLAIVTGPSMSPALTNRFHWYSRLPGNRQIGRSIHFFAMCGFILFFIIHIAIVAMTGLARNMNHIVIGVNSTGMTGIYLGLIGIGAVVVMNVFANWMAWSYPRRMQHLAKKIVTPVMAFTLGRAVPRAEFLRSDISPYLWVNGRVPTCDAWKILVADNFRDYRLRVYGLVENPVELSLEELRAMGKKTQITLHHCIQGWSGIAAWGGLPMAKLIQLVQPKPEAQTVIFYSYGEGGEGGRFYDSLSLENAMHHQTLLAYEKNYLPLEILNGAPLRLRVENQLGFKMVKWIEAIEFVESAKGIGKGEGGYNEDYEYFGESANI